MQLGLHSLNATTVVIVFLFYSHFSLNLKVYRSVLLRGRRRAPIGSNGSDGSVKGRILKVAIFYVLFCCFGQNKRKKEERNMKFNFLPRKH